MFVCVGGLEVVAAVAVVEVAGAAAVVAQVRVYLLSLRSSLQLSSSVLVVCRVEYCGGQRLGVSGLVLVVSLFQASHRCALRLSWVS